MRKQIHLTQALGSLFHGKLGIPQFRDILLHPFNGFFCMIWVEPEEMAITQLKLKGLTD